MIKKYDVAIIGGGLAGLTTAYYAHKSGMSVVILEKGTLGGGASGGLVGALAPHMPENWNDKKRYQFDALAMSPSFWEEIENISDQKTGYIKNGRLQNIVDERGLEKAIIRAEAAKIQWGHMGEWIIKEDGNHPFHSSPFGYIRDTLSAQIMPRDGMLALSNAVKNIGIEVRENFVVEDIHPQEINGTQKIHATHIVIAAGYASWPWVRKYLGADFGEGTKGQAVMVRPAKPWTYPMITGDGYYIVPHSPNCLAIGSTSERFWMHNKVDEQLDSLFTRVIDDIPTLGDAEILKTWSGIRPRAFRPDPLIGKLEEGIYINSGGFKTGFSFAPKLAQDLVRMIEGASINIPVNFLPKVTQKTLI